MSTASTMQDTATGVTTWTIDPAHSQVEFAVKHLMISTVRGRFGDIEGTVRVDGGDPARSVVDVTLRVLSIDTRQEQRDTHLRSADFFDVERFPTITFHSTSVDGDPESGEFKLIGDLTIRDVTRSVTLDVTSEGRGPDPWGGQRAGFSARTKLNRKDFGLTWNQALETGGVVVGDEIKVSIEVELVLQSGAAAQ